MTFMPMGPSRTRMKRLAMLAGLFALALFTLASIATPAAAQTNFPWCSNFSDGAGVNCGFSSYEQCMMTARGSGGTCERNDWYKGANTTAPVPPQARKRHGKNS
jgi:Protein of unknown function (DUF3551)